MDFLFLLCLVLRKGNYQLRNSFISKVFVPSRILNFHFQTTPHPTKGKNINFCIAKYENSDILYSNYYIPISIPLNK